MKVGKVRSLISSGKVNDIVVVSRLFTDVLAEFVIKPSVLLNKLDFESDETETTCELVGNDIWILGAPR